MRIFFDYGHGAFRLVQNLCADTSEQSCMESIHAPAADDNYPAVPFLGKVKNGFRRTANSVMRLKEHGLGNKPLCLLQDFLSFGSYGTCHAFRQPRHVIRICTAVKIRYMQDVNRSTCCICQNRGKTHGLVGSTGSVNRNQDTSQPFHTRIPPVVFLSCGIIREHMGKFL